MNNMMQVEGAAKRVGEVQAWDMYAHLDSNLHRRIFGS
jgi:hypothetical protein